MRKSKKPRDQVLRELRNAYEGGREHPHTGRVDRQVVRIDPQHAARIGHDDA